MAEITLVIGCKVHTSDNKVSGYVKSVIVDRGTRTVTHLVVEPKDREGLARLVPLDHADATADKIRLGYTEAEFKNLAAAEETLAEVFNSGPVELVTDGWQPADNDVPVVDGSKISPVRAEIITGEMDLVPRLVPTGEEEHRGDSVHATDGDIGQLRALCVDARTHEVTHVHVRLKEEHVWRHKEVAIPTGNVTGFSRGIHLNISIQQVENLAHGDIHHPI